MPKSIYRHDAPLLHTAAAMMMMMLIDSSLHAYQGRFNTTHTYGQKATIFIYNGQNIGLKYAYGTYISSIRAISRVAALLMNSIFDILISMQRFLIYASASRLIPNRQPLQIIPLFKIILSTPFLMVFKVDDIREPAPFLLAAILYNYAVFIYIKNTTNLFLYSTQHHLAALATLLQYHKHLQR